MPGRPPIPILRLPRQWDKRVRSAVLHAISRAPVRGRRGQRLGLNLSYLARRKRLAIVELKKAG